MQLPSDHSVKIVLKAILPECKLEKVGGQIKNYQRFVGHWVWASICAEDVHFNVERSNTKH